MTGDDPRHRYAYFKSGNVVQGLRLFGPKPARVPSGGPAAFFTDFLQMVHPSPLLLLTGGSERDQAARENVIARSYRTRGDRLHPFSSLLLESAALPALWGRLCRFRPSRLLCGQIGPPLWLFYCYSRLFRIPLVASLHNSIEGRCGSWHFRLRRAIDRCCLRRVAALVCHGPFLAQQLAAAGIARERIVVFDTGAGELRSRDGGHPPLVRPGPAGEGYLLFLGRVTADKGVFDLLEAFLALQSRYPGLKLVYVGDGPAFLELSRRKDVSKAGDRIELLGRKPYQQLGPVIQEAVALVAPTRSTFPEGRCMAALEGLAMGVPVIAPEHGPFPFAVRHRRNGLLYRPDSVTALTEAIELLLSDPLLYSSLRAGARQGRSRLLAPEVGFSTAVAQAFQLAGAGGG